MPRLILLIAVSLCFAQDGSFEVAVMKPSEPGRQGGSIGGGPGTQTPTRFAATNANLQNLLMYAYGVRGFQVVGPDWITDTRYDIQANIPPGATREGVRTMVQNLLAERLQLKVHHESRLAPVVVISVAKNGPKMKPAAAIKVDTQPEGPSVSFDRDGFPVLPGGKPAMISTAWKGQIVVLGRLQPMATLAEFLQNQLRQPVIDRTGLSGLYDFTLTFLPGGPAGPLDDTVANAPTGTSLLIAVQEQLGLRLELTKEPQATIVVDEALKIPTEN